MARRNDPRTIRGWVMYDWANSAYITSVAGVLFPIYFATQVVPPEGVRILGRTFDGPSLWALVVGFGAFVLFLAMPVLGAVADRSGAKRGLLALFAGVGSAATVALPLVGPGRVALALGTFLVTFVAFVAANVMYNGFLPEITTDDTIDRVSARGFAVGYAGGGLQLVLAIAIVAGAERLGIDRTTAERLAIASAGLWWGGFSAYALGRLRDRPVEPRPSLLEMARAGFARTWATTRRLRAFPNLLLFVVAFLLYNDGVQTIIALTSVYASETLGLTTPVVLGTFLVVQFVAVGGALLFGRLAEGLGTKSAILLAVAGWTAVAVAGALLPAGRPAPFVGLGVAVGIVMGGVQALSRSLYGSMIPEEASAEFFGFFAVFSKFSAIWGPLIFAAVGTLTGSTRLAVATLCAFFLLGGLLLALVDVDAARASRRRWRIGPDEVEVAR
ncbi:MAG TPA: MFS transporter [Actinobacteria bacterium]|nr:MFS transporter [Actinomycetota bacterium]